LEYLLFILYLVFFAWLATRIPFFKRSGLTQSQLIIVFLLKVMAGIFYGWIGLYYGGLAKMSDTWAYHTYGIQEYNLLLQQPGEYFTNLFYNPYEGDSFQQFFGASDSYWNDLKGNVFIKVMSVFDIFSFGYYYVNVILFSLLSLFGPVAIYRVMADAFPSKKLPVLLATFLVPSVLYWTSGIHKDGLIFVGISLVVYHVYFGLKENRFGVKRIAGILLGLFLLLLLRNYILVIIIPAVFAWLLASRWPQKGLVTFASLYVLFIVLFFSIRYISPQLDFPQAVVTKQKEFLKLEGNASVPIKELEPTVGSFMKSIPQAFTISTIRPYPSDVRHILSLAAAAEIMLLLILFATFLVFRYKTVQSNNFTWFCIFFSVSMLLAIGFSVNNLGAIVRYRSIIIPLLVVPMVAQTNWSRLNKLLSNGIKNNNNMSNSN
jgi:hypothetical protein